MQLQDLLVDLKDLLVSYQHFSPAAPEGTLLQMAVVCIHSCHAPGVPEPARALAIRLAFEYLTILVCCLFTPLLPFRPN